MESFVNNSSLISGLEAATKALPNDEKLRSSTLRSSVTSTDLENFFKTAPKFSVVEEEAFEEFWEQEKTMQITKLQTVLIGQNVSSSSCTVAFDEDEDKTVILEESACYDTTVEWTKEASEASSSMEEEEEETKEWEDDVGDDSRKDEKKPKGQLERLGRGLLSLERPMSRILTKKERSLIAWERRNKNTTLDLGYAKDENVMKKYCKDKARYPNIYEKIKKEAEYDKDYADDSRRHSPVHWRGFL